MHLNEKFIEAMKYMNTQVIKDNGNGHQWKYCNDSSKKARDFETARKKGKFLINCVDGTAWAALIAGIPSKALSFYGGDGKIVLCGSNAEKEAKKVFQIIKTGGKTVKQLYDNCELCDGDILLGYQGMCHTNAYYGGTKSFDSGHAYASGGGEGAKIKKLIGNLSHKNSRVNYILRIKDRAHYRVQGGAYSTDAAYNEMVQFLIKKDIPFITINEDGMKKIQLGYFSGKTNAERYGAMLFEKYKIDNFAKEI
jgi:hypothetical protein